jgi:3-hydroxyisobutyrate dehydrogenase-like beta-hydroxyacid dehydrogenase
MAGHLTKKGHKVTVYNRNAEKARKWAAEHGGATAVTPREAAEGAEIVFACVGADKDLRAVVYGDDGALAGMKKGAILVDHTTASAGIAREFDQAARAQGLGFLDAPVSGGQAGADVTHMGPAGTGQLTKMVNQICIAGVLQGLAEGLNFAQRAGLDGERVLQVISKGAAQSWQMDNRGKTMLKGEFDFGFAVDWMRKDLGLCIEEGNRNKALLPLSALVDQFYAHVQQRGGSRWDTSSLIHLLQKT